eukprot:689884-Prorocentrum_minimum.AAC.2
MPLGVGVGEHHALEARVVSFHAVLGGGAACVGAIRSLGRYQGISPDHEGIHLALVWCARWRRPWTCWRAHRWRWGRAPASARSRRSS